MSNKITFKALSKEDFEIFLKPYPAAQNIPDWWRSETPYVVSDFNPTGKKLSMLNGNSNASFKKCTPMLDALTSGYIVPLWTDVQVIQTRNGAEISWKNKRGVFQIHNINSQKVQPPVGYSNNVFKYMNTWIPITPKGYSVLVTSPFGYRQLPFQAIPAIIDSDKSVLEVITPMWVREGFEGIVEKGTPMFQVSPFKRESWESKFEYFQDNEHALLQEKNFNSTILNHYVKNVWSKKSYK